VGAADRDGNARALARVGVAEDHVVGDVRPRPAGPVGVGEVSTPRDLDGDPLVGGGRGQERPAHRARPPTTAFAVILSLPCCASRPIIVLTAVSAPGAI